MPEYTLFNKQTDKKLTHPRIGLWYSTDKLEAYNMLLACKEYLDAINLPQLKEFIVVVNAETGEEVSFNT